jgi:hypothetical protein
MNAYCDDQPVGQAHRLADDVDMAIGDRIEGSSKERNAAAGSRVGHGRGLPRVSNDRKASFAQVYYPIGTRLDVNYPCFSVPYRIRPICDSHQRIFCSGGGKADHWESKQAPDPTNKVESGLNSRDQVS